MNSESKLPIQINNTLIINYTKSRPSQHARIKSAIEILKENNQNKRLQKQYQNCKETSGHNSYSYPHSCELADYDALLNAAEAWSIVSPEQLQIARNDHLIADDYICIDNEFESRITDKKILEIITNEKDELIDEFINKTDETIKEIKK
ncbi:13904_t:CDS:2, partial [Funneliformis caledonium]